MIKPANHAIEEHMLLMMSAGNGNSQADALY